MIFFVCNKVYPHVNGSLFFKTSQNNWCKWTLMYVYYKQNKSLSFSPYVHNTLRLQGWNTINTMLSRMMLSASMIVGFIISSWKEIFLWLMELELELMRNCSWTQKNLGLNLTNKTVMLHERISWNMVDSW